LRRPVQAASQRDDQIRQAGWDTTRIGQPVCTVIGAEPRARPREKGGRCQYRPG